MEQQPRRNWGKEMCLREKECEKESEAAHARESEDKGAAAVSKVVVMGRGGGREKGMRNGVGQLAYVTLGTLIGSNGGMPITKIRS